MYESARSSRTPNRDVPWPIAAARCALLVVDMQNDFVCEGAPMEVPMARQRLPQMRQLIDLCRRRGVPVLFTRHVLYDGFTISPLEAAYQPLLLRTGLRSGSAGAEIVDDLTPLPSEIVIDKHRYDAFHNTQLETILRNIRGAGVVDTLIVVGTVTNVCCESTARSAFMRDFKVVFAADATGGFDESSQDATLRIIGQVFGRVLTTAEIIDALSE